MTSIEGDDLPVDPKQAAILGPGYRVSSQGCSVTSGGRISFFYYSAMGVKGAGYPVLSGEELEQLHSLIVRLGDDHLQVPPPGRRVVVQALISGKAVTRVYDRANLPDPVIALIRLTGAPIQPWTLEFKPQREGTTADFAKAAIPVPSFHTFSLDHTIDIAQGYYQVLVTTPGDSRTLQEPEINRHINALFGPVFTQTVITCCYRLPSPPYASMTRKPGS